MGKERDTHKESERSNEKGRGGPWRERDRKREERRGDSWDRATGPHRRSLIFQRHLLPVPELKAPLMSNLPPPHTHTQRC